jgi:hypothetical protein
MKAAIVTFTRAYNHGAVLQCYALHKKLNDLGIDNEVLDYCPEYFRKVYNLESIRKWKWFPGSIIGKTPRYIKMRQKLSKRNRGFEKFIKKNIRLSSKRYCSLEDIRQENFSYDAFIVGSDQVWCDIWTDFDPVFFLDFPISSAVRKIAYAASFGYTAIPDHLREEYKKRLKNWDAYSVREASGQEILSQLLGVSSVRCCDPTILLTGEDWRKIAIEPVCKKPYILVYYVKGSKYLLEHAQKLAAREKLNIITVTSICTYEHLMGTYEGLSTVIHKGTCSPDEFLGLVLMSKYVLTDSFHGTVFSILFHKKFLTLLNNGGHTNNRAAELLDYLQLGERTLEKGLGFIDKEVSWNYVESRLQEYRKQSVEYLDKQFDEVE